MAGREASSPSRPPGGGDPDRVSRKAFDRERAARKQSERLLEEKSRELYDRNEAYRRLNEQLEARVASRTRELAESLERAQAGEQAKAAFLANMSHEIRTPLTAIIGFAEILRDEEADPKQTAETICRHGSHLLSLINDVLDLSKFESGNLSVERVAVRPTLLVTDVVDLYRTRAEQRGVDLDLVIEPGLPGEVSTDPTRLRQVLINLIGNALKFTEQGCVRLEVGFDEHRDLMRFSLSDTGIGMTAEQLGVIRRFESFRQADESTTRQYGGTGLGLAISSQIVRALGGELRVESSYGRGSTFSFEITVGRISSDSAGLKLAGELGDSSGAVDLTGAHVLVVDDGADNRRLFAHHLKRAGASVDLAEHGQDAIDQLRHSLAGGQRFSLVLMDMQMPVLDGCEATRRLRAMGWTIPILAATANTAPEDREQCIEAGCDGFVSKPISKIDLLRTCVDVIARHNRAVS